MLEFIHSLCSSEEHGTSGVGGCPPLRYEMSLGNGLSICKRITYTLISYKSGNMSIAFHGTINLLSS